MITSIVLTDCHNLRVNSDNKTQVDDQVISLTKDVPFIRYRFNNYGEREINYIKESIKKFEMPTHLIEIPLSDDTASVLKQVKDEKIAKFIYIDIDDTDVERGTLTDEVLDMLQPVFDYEIDRIMLKDKSTKLDLVAFRKISEDLAAEYSLEDDMVGVCSSPLSFNGLACLTAVKAREIMSNYDASGDVALPSANHQCMNTCGCIRYLIIDKDTIAAASKVNNKTSKSEKSSESKPKATTKSKATVYDNSSFF